MGGRSSKIIKKFNGKKKILAISALLKWFSANGRSLPWRTGYERRDIYHVWLSEVMLQQTRVETVIPYYTDFIKRWKNFTSLANANMKEVLKAWQGMGYYRRAHNLHRCAIEVSKKFNGKLPSRRDDLLKLPGIGEYTASAICSIGYGQPILAVDGNVKRVLARLFFLYSFHKDQDSLLREIANNFLSNKKSGEFQEAMMDLGSMICKPKNPKCDICPLRGYCLSFKNKQFNLRNHFVRKKDLPRRNGVVFWCLRKDGSVFVSKRKSDGLLGGFMEFPSVGWDLSHAPKRLSNKDLFQSAPFESQWLELPDKIHHTFSHFHLELKIWKGRINPKNVDLSKRNGIWIKPVQFKRYPFPTLMKKIAQYVQKIN